MMKASMANICEALGLEIGDEFVFELYPELIFTFTNTELSFEIKNDFYIVNAKEYDATELLFDIIKQGKSRIRIRPWTPKKGDKYYTFRCSYTDEGDIWSISSPLQWCGSVIDIALLKQGWVFKTEERARLALPKISKSLNVKYEV